MSVIFQIPWYTWFYLRFLINFPRKVKNILFCIPVVDTFLAMYEKSQQCSDESAYNLN